MSWRCSSHHKRDIIFIVSTFYFSFIFLLNVGWPFCLSFPKPRSRSIQLCCCHHPKCLVISALLALLEVERDPTESCLPNPSTFPLLQSAHFSRVQTLIFPLENYWEIELSAKFWWKTCNRYPREDSCWTGIRERSDKCIGWPKNGPLNSASMQL